MKTLEQIKDDYAVSQGFENWRNLFLNTSECFESFEYYENEVMILTQKECLKLASENAFNHFIAVSDSVQTNVRKAITNENNIVI